MPADPSLAPEAATAAHAAKPVALDVEFTGGLESLFHSQRKHEILLEAGSNGPTTIRTLIQHLTTKTSPGANLSLFIDPECLQGAGTDWTVAKMDSITVRPGILVLINDADWELEGGEDAELGEGDEVVFVSTLHGG